uniref:Uncharacterized protein n=1 Tax=Sus scrofa TaxID=9823 RepID=A0A4X1VU80_PIG
ALAPLWLRLPPQPAGGAPSPSGASRRPCRSASSAASRFPASRPGGPPRPAELLTRLLSRCPQLRSGRCSLGAPPPRFLPRQLCPDRAAALDRTPFLPSFILSGNSHSSSACDVPRTRPLRPSECGPPGSSQKPLPSSPRPGLSSLMSCFTQRVAFNCSLIISPVKGQSVARSREGFVTEIRGQSESRVRDQNVARVGVQPNRGRIWR